MKIILHSYWWNIRNSSYLDVAIIEWSRLVLRYQIEDVIFSMNFKCLSNYEIAIGLWRGISFIRFLSSCIYDYDSAIVINLLQSQICFASIITLTS